MIFKILLSRNVQAPNSDKNWQTSCPLQTFVTQSRDKSLPGTMQILLFGAGDKYSYFLTLSSTQVLDKIRYSTEYSSSKSSIRTPLHISRHLEFIIEQGHRVNWVSGSLGHKM